MNAPAAAMLDRPLFRFIDARVEARPDGSIVLRAAHALPAYARCLTERVREWARIAPSRPCLAERAGDGWRTMTYAEVADAMRRIGAALLARGLGAERPVFVLSGNDLGHALIALGAMDVGIPFCPVSTAYSLISQDFGKLRYAVQLMTPGLVYATQGRAYQKAIAAAIPPGVEVVIGDGTHAELGATALADLLQTSPSREADVAHAAVSGDTIAKFLLTSGSTGMPKAVINTQRMLCANQAMLREAMVFLQAEPPVMLDWLPWSHTFGGNHNLGIALYNGGTLYLDDGKPMPGAIEATVRNLRDVAPTIYFNVPKGYEALLPYLRADETLRERVFGRLKFVFYAGAGLSKTVWDEIRALSQGNGRGPIRFVTSLGSTETAPAAITNCREEEEPGIVGLPLPGVEIKLTPEAGKLRAWLKGDNVTPGYWRRDDLTRAAFDAEGFYDLGDALRPKTPGDFRSGLVFDGRMSEDFKLATATWVSVGPLRAQLIDHFAPLMRDVVIAGHDRDEIGILVFPDVDACRRHAKAAAEAPVAEVLAHPHVCTAFRERLAALAARAKGSSTRVTRAMLLVEPASIDRGEATDKGSLNQRAVLEHRVALVEELYATPPSARVIAIESEQAS